MPLRLLDSSATRFYASVFAAAFVVGAGMESFMIATGFYDTCASRAPTCEPGSADVSCRCTPPSRAAPRWAALNSMLEHFLCSQSDKTRGATHRSAEAAAERVHGVDRRRRRAALAAGRQALTDRRAIAVHRGRGRFLGRSVSPPRLVRQLGPPCATGLPRLADTGPATPPLASSGPAALWRGCSKR